MKKCASCSKDLPDSAQHCVFCGAKQQAPAPAPGQAKTVMGYQASDVIKQMQQQAHVQTLVDQQVQEQLAAQQAQMEQQQLQQQLAEQQAQLQQLLQQQQMAAPPPAAPAAPAPAAFDADAAAMRITKLKENFTYMRDGLKQLGFDLGHTQTSVIPIYIREDLRTIMMWRDLLEDYGIYTNPFISPGVPPKHAMLRTSYMATHEKAHLDRGLEAFEKVGKKYGVI